MDQRVPMLTEFEELFLCKLHECVDLLLGALEVLDRKDICADTANFKL